MASLLAWAAPARAGEDARYSGIDREWAGVPFPLRLAQLRERWRSLSPEERRHLREQVRQWRELPPEERQARREALRRNDPPPREDREGPPGRAPQRQGLSPDERRRLRQQILEQEWRGGRGEPYRRQRGR
ncbi:MAG: hypothetical protein OHK0026_17740 [Rhodocyclaceae bacterium]